MRKSNKVTGATALGWRRIGEGPVTAAAAIKSINRALRKQGEMLRVARGARAEQDCGRYYTVDEQRNLLTGKDVDLELFGRELGVIGEREHVVEE